MKTTNVAMAPEIAADANEHGLELEVTTLTNDVLAMVGGGDGITLLG